MHRTNVLSLLNAPKRGVLDVLRLKVSFREYARELAIAIGIDAKASYRSSKLTDKAPLIRDVWAVLDLVREYVEITNPNKPIEWRKLLTDEEVKVIDILLEKMSANKEVEQTSVEELLGQD